MSESQSETPAQPTDAVGTETGDGPIVAPRRIRGRHLAGITAVAAIAAFVGFYFVGRDSAPAKSSEARGEEVAQAGVVAIAADYGDFLLEEQQRLVDDEDASDEERELAEQIGYDDLLEDSGAEYDDRSRFAVEIHDIKDDDARPRIDEGEDEASSDEIDDNSLVIVQVGDVAACLDLDALEQSGSSLDAVTPGGCEV